MVKTWAFSPEISTGAQSKSAGRKPRVLHFAHPGEVEAPCMAIRRTRPPWDYLHDASIASLESYELSRLNHAANLRREIAALMDQWIDDTTQALLARWVREDRTLPRAAPAPTDETPISEPPFMDPPLCGEPPRAARAIRTTRRNAH